MALTRDVRNAAKEKWRAIQRNGAPKRLNITFPCTETDIHTFSLIEGDLFFFNHKMSDLKALAVMDKLQHPRVSDSTACGCVKIMRFFMDRLSSYDVGYGFFNSTSVRDSMMFPANKRNCRKEFQAVFPAPIPAEQVIKNKFCDLMTKTFLKDITYRRPTHEVFRRDGKGGGDYVQEAVPFKLTVSVGAEPAIEGYLKENKQRNVPDEPTINVTLPLSYYSRVFTKGLAVVDGNIILARLYDFDNGSFLALVGKQTYGYKITKEYAVVHPERNHISYIGEEKAKEILVNGKTPRSRRTKKELGK
jgi:hypothetical protein